PGVRRGRTARASPGVGRVTEKGSTRSLLASPDANRERTTSAQPGEGELLPLPNAGPGEGWRSRAGICLDNSCSNRYKERMTAHGGAGKVRGRFDSPEQEAYLNLWRTYDRLRALEDELFARFELTAQQYNALRLLQARHPEPMPTLAVAGRLVSRAPDITRLLDRLEQRGLV